MKRIDQLRRIVENCTGETIDGVYVDLFSASAYVQVYDALNEENQAKQESVSLGLAMDRVWKLINKLQGEII